MRKKKLKIDFLQKHRKLQERGKNSNKKLSKNKNDNFQNIYSSVLKNPWRLKVYKENFVYLLEKSCFI